MRLHRRPFGRDDAVDHRVTQRAVRRDLMTAQDAIEFGAQPFDPAPRLVIDTQSKDKIEKGDLTS